MAQDLAPIFGNSSDGVATLSGADAPIDSSFSGTSGALTGSATNASFSANQKVLIHHSRGTTSNTGGWEVNEILSYVAGTVTFKNPLANTYTDSGSDQSQILVLKQYSQVTVSGTLTAKSWDGNVGGIIAFLCSGLTTISGSITANGGNGGNEAVNGTQSNSTGGGFRGGKGSQSGTAGEQGEGTAGAGWATLTTGNGNGAGGFSAGSGDNSGGGSGGGNGVAGSLGTNGSGGTPGIQGTVGAIAGGAALTTMVFGGAASGGGNGTSGGGAKVAGVGGSGAGIVLIFTKNITISGSITANGGNGGNGNDANAGNGSGGGGGSGGSVLIKTQTAILGTNLITATGGSGGSAVGTGGAGGAGGAGRVAIEHCSLTGTTNPTATTTGGRPWCASDIGGII